MNFTSKIADKLYYKQWTIGVGQLTPDDFIRNRKSDFPVNWLDLGNELNFIADPFFVEKIGEEGFTILVEEFRAEFDYGILTQIKVGSDMKNPRSSTTLNTGSHLSYPFLFSDNGNWYMIPEAGASGKLPCYHYNIETGETQFVKNLIDKPLIDPTIIHKDGKFWLFATSAPPHHNDELFLFSAENFLGPYLPHPGNPIKKGLKGTRPAGNIIEVDGSLYRPAQDCSVYYGGAIIINKINSLNTDFYHEEPFMEILPRVNTKYDFGIHTINFFNGYVVVDGLRRFLAPVKKARQAIVKRFK